MARKFKEARQMHKLTIAEAAEKLGVSSAALSTWESEKKSPTLDNLIGMAELYGVTTDYLLGRSNEPHGNSGTRALAPEELRIRNGLPVWSDRHGWLLVDAAASCLLRSDGTRLPLLDAGELFAAEPTYAAAPIPHRSVLRREELKLGISVWVEPISPDADLRNELRGWYRICDSFAENDVGHRFPLSSYTARWLAFAEEG